MAQLDVKKKENNDLWKWLLGILAAIIIIWVIVENTGEDDNYIEEETTTTAINYNSPSITTTVMKV